MELLNKLKEFAIPMNWKNFGLGIFIGLIVGGVAAQLIAAHP
jgi:hypothetical protein